MESPNIILLVMDTARAKTVVPALKKETLPHLSKFARDSVLFNNASTVAPWTLPSHASIFSGQYTSSHQTDANTPDFQPDSSSLAGKLSKNGYSTAGISANPWVSPEFNFDQGFDQFSMKWDEGWESFDVTAAVNAESTIEGLLKSIKQTPIQQLPALMKSLWHKRFHDSMSDNGAKEITTRAKRWIKQQKQESEPFFLFLNYLEPHLPYEPPSAFIEEFLSEEELATADEIDQDPWKFIVGRVEHDTNEFDLLRKLYLIEILYLDAQIGELFDFLKSEGVYEDTAIFIIGDHGENIGEHDLMDHQYCLYETLVNVPLLAKHPELETGTVDERLIESRDLYPTILQLAGIPMNNLPSPVSQEPITTSSRDYAISEYLTPQPDVDTLAKKVNADLSPSRFDRALRSIRTKEWKLIESSDGSHELYNVSIDVEEQNDLYDDEPDIAEKLRSRLSESIGPLTMSEASRQDISKNSKQRLEELGYLQ
ncbi:sulfatase [Halorussus salinus]|uniref:sulfatase n=1 Tax=Halorussus salinus TaxID=1364935 RepID=UPI001091CB50|nr:sulfatase [Halorussus salinus]